MGRNISIRIIDALLDFGLGRDKAEWVYRSKHLRWFFDRNHEITEEVAYSLMTKYLQENSNGVLQDLCMRGFEKDPWEGLGIRKPAFQKFVENSKIPVSTEYGSLFLSVKLAFLEGWDSHADFTK